MNIRDNDGNVIATLPDPVVNCQTLINPQLLDVAADVRGVLGMVLQDVIERARAEVESQGRQIDPDSFIQVQVQIGTVLHDRLGARTDVPRE